MENFSKIHVKVGEIEVSVEGTAEFVSEQYLKVLGNIKNYAQGSSKVPEKISLSKESAVNVPKADVPAVSNNGGLPKSFDQWLGKLPEKASGTDKALLAGYFAQTFGKNAEFKVRDVSKILKASEVRLTNPSSLLRSACRGRSILEEFAGEGKQSYYRFTEKGEKYITQLMEN